MAVPQLSVIIPCYNNGPLLSEMINCILRQTYDDWELIVVDDGSTDDTPAIVGNFAANDSRIRLVQRDREPKGSATCRNIGFDHSRGRYIMHLDADDLLADTCFERRVTFMETNPEIDYASFPAKIFTDSTHLPSISNSGKHWGVGNETMDLLTSFLHGDYLFSVWCNIYRRSSLLPFRWDENVKIYTDFSFIVPGILSGKLKHKFGYQDQVDYYYRVNQSSGNNVCASFVNADKCTSTIYLFGKTLDALAQRDDYAFRREEFFHFIILNFRRLIEGGDKHRLNDYLAFCKSHYPEKIDKMQFISNMSIYLSGNIVRRKMSALLCMGLFGHR